MPTTFASTTLAELTRRLEARQRTTSELAHRSRADAAAALEDLDVSDLLDSESPDGGSNGIERALALRLATLAGRAAGDAEAALARLAEGRYGTCEDCRRHIPLARLRVVPETTLCVTCKGAGERLLAGVG